MILLIGSNLFYCLIVGALDGFAFHYMSPIAIPMGICVVMTITAGAELVLPKRKKASCVSWYSCDSFAQSDVLL